MNLPSRLVADLSPLDPAGRGKAASAWLQAASDGLRERFPAPAYTVTYTFTETEPAEYVFFVRRGTERRGVFVRFMSAAPGLASFGATVGTVSPAWIWSSMLPGFAVPVGGLAFLGSLGYALFAGMGMRKAGPVLVGLTFVAFVGTGLVLAVAGLLVRLASPRGLGRVRAGCRDAVRAAWETARGGTLAPVRERPGRAPAAVLGAMACAGGAAACWRVAVTWGATGEVLGPLLVNLAGGALGLGAGWLAFLAGSDLDDATPELEPLVGEKKAAS